MSRQIRFILLQNRQGRTRLAKYYVPLDDGEKRKLEFDIHRLVVNRDPKFTNFLEVRHRAAAARCGNSAGVQSPFGAAAHSALRSAAHRQRAGPALQRGHATHVRASALHAAARALRQRLQRSTLVPKSALTRRPRRAVPHAQGDIPPLRRPLLLYVRGHHRCVALACQVHALHLKPRAENELACLESIHLFVEILDTYFSHVCELDLVWHFHKARGM